jgi:hypothetical protein
MAKRNIWKPIDDPVIYRRLTTFGALIVAIGGLLAYFDAKSWVVAKPVGIPVGIECREGPGKSWQFLLQYILAFRGKPLAKNVRMCAQARRRLAISNFQGGSATGDRLVAAH